MPLRDFRWARDPSRHRSSDPTGRASESEGYVRAGVYQCSSPENLVSSSPAIRKRLQTFRLAPTSLKTRGGRLPRRCFLAWCTQFQITHVFLEAVPVLRPSIDFKTCESLLTSRLEPGAFTKTHRHRAFDASSFSRLNPLRRRMDRRPLLESVFLIAAPPRSFFSRASLARRPQDGRRRLDALLAQGRHVVVHLQVPRLAHALRPGAVPTGQMREPARVVWASRSNVSTRRQGRHGARLRRGRQPADAVFRARPRDAEARRIRLREIRQEGAVFLSSIQHQLVTSQAMQDTVTSRELFERMPTRPALAEPEVAAHKVRSYEEARERAGGGVITIGTCPP